MDPAANVPVPTSGSEGPGLIDLMVTADPIVQLVLLLLIAMSVGCWAIIAQKAVRLRAASQQSQAFLDMFWKSRRLDQVYERTGEYAASPVAAMFSAGYKELTRAGTGDTENLERALRRSAQTERTALERHLPFLGTTGSTAPFIGLFGTVWGILQAFLKLGQPGSAATIQVVGPDIAHALVATAVGLMAAIPAVMAYNGFLSTLRVLETEMDSFGSDLLNLVKRQKG